MSCTTALHVSPITREQARFVKEWRTRSSDRIQGTRLRSALDPLGPTSQMPSGRIKKKKNLKSFNRYLEVECWKRRELRDLEPVFQAVSDACKQINRIVQRAQTDDLYGVAVGSDGNPLLDTNIQGEVQQKLDVVCNTIMLRAFCGCSSAICTVASEEEDILRSCEDVMGNEAFSVGKYVAVFDPIDGSKNIDSSLPVGSIFGIYEKQLLHNHEDGFIPQGRGLVAAGYCLFS